MQLIVITASASYSNHLQQLQLTNVEMQFVATLTIKTILQPEQLIIYHRPKDGFNQEILQYLQQNQSYIMVATDQPNLAEMLQVSKWKVVGYCNSYMAKAHYKQMLEAVAGGQTWYPPQLLSKAIQLARIAMTAEENQEDYIGKLTEKERKVALDVAKGLTNREIANGMFITERTVKAHLSNIFSKLQLKDRVTLAININKWTKVQ